MSRSTAILLGLGLLLLVGVIAFALSIGRSGPGSDRLDGSSGEGTSEATAADPEARCAASATYDRLKRELFRQAATTRGSDLAAFDQLAAYAAIRVTSPVLREQDQGLERVTCSGAVSLDLPPGVQVVGGRRTLTANVQYSLQPAADASGDVVTLRGAQAIIVPLATLARIGQPAAEPAAPAKPVDEEVEPTPLETEPPATSAPEPEPAPRTEPGTAARPSFNCANARTRSEIAVCGSTDLAALDRQMAGFYGNAYRESGPEVRALLERTRGRFLAFRDRCTSDRCIADAYRGRITEIRDIVDGRWQDPR